MPRSPRRRRGDGTLPYQVHAPECPNWRPRRHKGDPEPAPRREVTCRCPWRASYVTAAGARRYLRGSTEARVNKALKDAIADRDRGQGVEPGRGMTLADWLWHWLQQVKRPELAPRTYTGYRQKMRDHVMPHIGGVRLERLTPEAVEGCYAALHRSGLGPHTVLQIHRILAEALKDAYRRGHAPRNVAELVKAPRAIPGDIDPLYRDEARAILTEAAQHREAARWSVGLSLGVRQGAVLGLTWPDVDLWRDDDGTAHGTLTIRRQLQRLEAEHGCGDERTCPAASPSKCPRRVRGRLVLREIKTARYRRAHTVQLPPTLAAQLLTHRAEQNAERLEAGDSWVDWPQPDGTVADLVFRQRNGAPWDPRRDWQAWKDLLVAADVRTRRVADAKAKDGYRTVADPRLHDARHTAATIMLAQGIPLRVVMDILGHSQISMTVRYTHLVPELDDAAARAIESGLWGEDDGAAGGGRRRRRAR